MGSQGSSSSSADSEVEAADEGFTMSYQLSPLEVVDEIADEASKVDSDLDSERRKCLNPKCRYLARDDLEQFHAYCCKTCKMWQDNGYKRGTAHGLKCQKIPCDDRQPASRMKRDSPEPKQISSSRRQCYGRGIPEPKQSSS